MGHHNTVRLRKETLYYPHAKRGWHPHGDRYDFCVNLMMKLQHIFVTIV